jgi:hypothetical protein
MRKKLALLGLCGGAVLGATAIATIAKADDLPDNRYRDQDGRVDCKLSARCLPPQAFRRSRKVRNTLLYRRRAVPNCACVGEP